MNAIAQHAVGNKVSLNTDELKAALTQACRFVPKARADKSLAVFSHVHIQGTNTGITVSATNGENAFTAKLTAFPSTIDICVNAKELLAFVKNASMPFIDLEVNNMGELVCSSNVAKAHFNGAPVAAEIWDSAPKIDDKISEPLSFTREHLRSVLDKLMPTIQPDKARKCLSGVYIQTKLGAFVAVATDGHRLCEVDTCHYGDSMPDGIIVNYELLKQIYSRVKQRTCPGIIFVKLTKKHSEWTFGQETYTGKNVCGTYPSYERVIPPYSDTQVTVDAGVLAKALKAAGLAKGGKAARFKVSGAQMEVTHSANGQSTAFTVPVEATEDVEIGFNASYVFDMLSAFSGPMTIHINDRNGPVRADQSSMRYVLMPMRT